MNYKESLDFLQELCKFGINLGLERITKLLSLLGDPHLQIKTIHVAGTNGKGSTSAILASILQSAGYKVGVYTSPHLHSYTERIRINGSNISQNDFSAGMEKLKLIVPQVLKATGESPTEFEILTALALEYFKEQEVDIAVLEVGMGGRLDSTNVIRPEITVITSISSDHTNHLGFTLTDIAKEKAGVIKERVPIVTSIQNHIVENVLKEKALNSQAPIYSIKDTYFKQLSFSQHGQEFTLKTKLKTYDKLYLPLLGDHQIENAVTAITCIEVLQSMGWKITSKDVEEGLVKVKWPGRLEYLPTKPPILLDGAHNPQGALALSLAIPKYFTYEKLIMALGVLGDKDRKKIIEYLAPLVDVLIITKPPHSRAGDWRSLAQLAKAYNKEVLVKEDFHKAIDTALSLGKTSDLVCITGSLYLLGESREYVLNTFFQT